MVFERELARQGLHEAVQGRMSVSNDGASDIVARSRGNPGGGLKSHV